MGERTIPVKRCNIGRPVLVVGHVTQQKQSFATNIADDEVIVIELPSSQPGIFGFQ